MAELEQDSDFTGILQKANIDTQTVNLMDYDAVPEDAMAVFVNAPTEDLSSDDAQKILNYLNNGGDIFINTAYTGKDMPNLNKLLDFYGVITEAAVEDTTEDTAEYITEAAAEDDTAQGTDGENAETIRQVNQDTVSAYLDDICAFTAKQEITDVTVIRIMESVMNPIRSPYSLPMICMYSGSEITIPSQADIILRSMTAAVFT